MVHGHQGTLDADVFDFLPPQLLPLYRDFQNITNLGHTSPSRDDCLRGLQDTFLYRWASAQKDLILIAGHTHRPVWTSQDPPGQPAEQAALPAGSPARL
jgi:hypothetical protein